MDMFRSAPAQQQQAPAAKATDGAANPGNIPAAPTVPSDPANPAAPNTPPVTEEVKNLTGLDVQLGYEYWTL